jgi:hypothetical protein
MGERTRGPKPVRLRIDGPWEKAVGRAVGKKPSKAKPVKPKKDK